MEDAFDPYHKWLGIPPAKQPPTCYRLLGVPEFEDDPEVIEAAADRQMAFVRTLQTGARAELSQMILNELARARAVLLDPRQKADYVSQAARGLIQLHLQRVYHRNLKPHVLMVDMAGNLKVSNLFLARVDESSSFATGAEKLTIQGQSLGSVHYLSPEQADDAHDADARSDMYALGCTLCFLLTGQPPYTSKSSIEVLIGHASQPVPSLRQRREEILESLERVFKKMLSKDPAGRYQFMGDLIDELEACAKKPLLGRMLGKVSRLFPKP